MFKLDLEKGRGNSDQIASIYWIIEEARDFQKNIYFCCIDCTKAFDCVNHNELWTSKLHVQAGLRKGRGTRDQIADMHWIIEKARDFQKNIHFCFID